MADYLQFLGSLDQNPAPFLLPEQAATPEPEPMLMPGQVPVKRTFGMPILSEEEFLAMKRTEEQRNAMDAEIKAAQARVQAEEEMNKAIQYSEQEQKGKALRAQYNQYLKDNDLEGVQGYVKGRPSFYDWQRSIHQGVPGPVSDPITSAIDLGTDIGTAAVAGITTIANIPKAISTGVPLTGAYGVTRDNLQEMEAAKREDQYTKSQQTAEALAKEETLKKNPLAADLMPITPQEKEILKGEHKSTVQMVNESLSTLKDIALSIPQGWMAPLTGYEGNPELEQLAYGTATQAPLVALGTMGVEKLGAEVTSQIVNLAREGKALAKASKAAKSTQEMNALRAQKDLYISKVNELKSAVAGTRGKELAKTGVSAVSKAGTEAGVEQAVAKTQGDEFATTANKFIENVIQEHITFDLFKYPSFTRQLGALYKSRGGLSSKEVDLALKNVMIQNPQEYSDIAKHPQAKQILGAIANITPKKGQVTPSYDLRLDTQALTGQGISKQEQEAINNAPGKNWQFTDPPAEGYSGLEPGSIYSVPGYFTPGNENAKDIRANLPRKTLFFDADANTVQEETFHGAMSQIRKENPTLMNRAESAAENMRTQFMSLMDSYRKGEVTDPEARGKIQTLARALETTPEKLKEANLGGEELIHAALFPKYRANEAEQALGKLFGLPNQLREDLLSALGKPLAKMSVGAKKAIIRGEEGITPVKPSKSVQKNSITPAQDKVITHIQSLLNKNGIRPPKGDISHWVDKLSEQGRPKPMGTYAEQKKELERAKDAKQRYVDFIAAVDSYLDESDSHPELFETGFGGGTGSFSADDLISKINEWTARGTDVRESSSEDYSPKTLLTEGWTSREQGPEMTKMEAWDTPSEVYVAGMKLTSEVRKGKIVFKDENGKPVIAMNPDETVFIDTDAPTPATNNDRDLDILDLKADARKARETEQKEKAKAKKETEDKKKEQAEIAAIERSQERIRQEHKAKQEAEDKRNKSFDKAEIGKERDTTKDTKAGKENTEETRKVIPSNIAEDEFNREIQERMAAEAQFKKEWLEKRSETQQAEFKQAIKEIDENAPAPAWQPSHTKIGNRLGMSAHRLNRALADIHASIYEMEKLLPNKLLQSGYSEYRRLPAITSNVIEKKIAPLTKAIEDLLRKEGIKFEDASEYAYAVHALNINSFRKSGITDKEAELIKERVIAGSKKRESALERMVNTLIPAINDVKMDALVEAGVYTREQVNAWKKKYKLYVPLKTDEQGVVSFEYETLSDLVYMINKNLGDKMMEGKKSGDAFKTSLANKQTVSSTGVRTPPVGRSLKADSPLAFAVRDAVNGIIKAEQVKAQSVVLDWIKANQDPGWITVSKPQFKDWSENEKGIWEPNWRTADGQFSKGFGDNTEKGTAVILQNGAYYQIQANPNNAFAMSTLHSIVADDLYKMWEITKLASAVNNYRSTVLTRINPLFAATNTPKDFQQMVTKTFIRHGLKASAFTLLKFPGAVGISAVKKAGFLFPKILEDFANGKVNKDYSFERWVELGGPTSYMKPNTIQDIATSMQQAVDGGFQLGKVKEYVFNTLSFVNEVLETAIRISTYRAVMAVMPKGLSLEQQEAYEKNAVLFSREVSVDFNMKGYASPFFNMYHMFFNPGAQSVRSMTQDFMIDKQTTRRAVAVYTAATLFGMGLTIYNRMMGGNDDDTEENLWDTIDSSKKATNILISLGKKRGYYVIPLMFGGPGIAVILGQTIMGMTDYFLKEGTNRDNFYESQFMASMTNAALASVDPLGVGFENPVQALVPSFATPIWELKTNKNNIGMDIVPDKGSSPYTRPESGKYYAKTPQYMKDIAAKWNELNGGSKYQSSGLYPDGKEKPLGFAKDVSPEIFMYGASYIGGGLFNLANNLRVMHQTPAEEVPEKVDRLAVNAFTKRWFYKPKDQVARMNVYDNLNNLAILEAKLGDIGKLSGKQASRDYATEIAPELMYYSSYIGMAKADKFWNSAEETGAYQWSKKFMDSKEEDSEETVARRKAIEKLYRPYFKKSLEYKKAYAQGDIDKVLELKLELKMMLKNAGKPTGE